MKEFYISIQSDDRTGNTLRNLGRYSYWIANINMHLHWCKWDNESCYWLPKLVVFIVQFEQRQMNLASYTGTAFFTGYGSCLPIFWKSSGSCTSTFSLWNMWYSACSQMGGIWLNCRATEYASYNKQREISLYSFAPYKSSNIQSFSPRQKMCPWKT